VAYFVTRQTLPMYSHKKSPHIYSLPQLISCVLLKIYIRNMSYRDLEEFLLSSGDIKRVLGLRRVPNYSTFSRVCNRVTGKEIKRILGKVLEVVISRRDVGFLFACDSTGFKEDVASFYYTLRSGKRRKGWIKVWYLLDTRTQALVSWVIGRGPSGDSMGLSKLEKKSPFRPLIEVMDRGFDGSGNIRFGLPIRVIPPIRRGGSIRSLDRILAYMVYMISRWSGIYGKRWLCETMISVIKRKFGDSIRERKWGNKKKIVSLMAIVYNIHVIVRGGGENQFLILLVSLSFKSLKIDVCNRAFIIYYLSKQVIEMGKKFTQELWREIEDIYKSILSHPFLKGLTDGSLDENSFRFYVIQDALYLREFARTLSIAAAKSPREKWIMMFNEHSLGALKVERALHESFFRDFGLKKTDILNTPLAPTNLAYTSYLLAVAYSCPFSEIIGAVLPCYWIYWEVGKALVSKGSPNPLYQRWIDTYAGEEYSKIVEAVLTLTEEIARELKNAEKKAFKRHFVTTSRFEWMFWDMGFRCEQWPV
jgi:thiaminase/transcriptional activator TenA